MGTKFVVQEQELLMVMQIALKNVLKDDTLTAPLMERLTSSVKSYLHEECERVEDGKRADVSLDDVITKRAAIDALNHLYLYPGEWAVNGLNLCKDAIANLPSDDNDSLYQKLNEAHNEGYDVGYWAGRRDYEQKWIPCSERLPEEKDAGILKKLGINKRSDDVIATVDVNGARMTVTTCTHDGKWDWNMKYAFPDFKVVAWMPLPKPYERED